MKIRVMSDLHLESMPLDPPVLSCDVVVLAGDIDPVVNGRAALWARASFRESEIVWVLGNHEHYGWKEGGLKGCLAGARELARAHDVQVLENEGVVINGTRFLGCTLWTDFDLHSTPSENMAHARRRLSDFTGMIRVPRALDVHLERDFTPEDSVALHCTSKAWLKSQLARPHSGKTVVVTHHAPHARCEHAAHAGGNLAPAFCSDLGEMIEDYQPELWISGHTHASHDFRVRKTRLVSNQRGYSDIPEHADAPFDVRFCVDL